jgi:carbon monoxide dehydrogenase subunit G
MEDPLRVALTEVLPFPPEAVFSVLTDIAHHTDWLEGTVELITLIDGPAGWGTTWEHRAVMMGKTFVSANVCNVFESKRKFGWISGKPFVSQVNFVLEPAGDLTRLEWVIEAEEAGIVQLAEPLLERLIREMLVRSLVRLKRQLYPRNSREITSSSI